MLSAETVLAVSLLAVMICVRMSGRAENIEMAFGNNH
jgi:hypothetical protein